MMNYDEERAKVLKGTIAGGIVSLGGWILRKAVNSKPWNVIGAVIEGVGSVGVAMAGIAAAAVDINEAFTDIANSEK